MKNIQFDLTEGEILGFVGLVALGQALVLLVGGVDLSVEAAAGLGTIVGSLILTKLGIHPYAVLPLAMGFGLLLGALNVFFVASLRLNPFIVTLAAGEIFAGMTLVITEDYPIRPLGDTFQFFLENGSNLSCSHLLGC